MRRIEIRSSRRTDRISEMDLDGYAVGGLAVGESHAEMYHVLEYYMSKGGKKLYNEWANLNPKDFQYNEDTSKLTKDYVYDKESEDVTNSYFLTKYSKATEKEDRAEIFAEIMILKNAPVYLKSDCNIRKKVDSIKNTLNNEITYSDFYFSKYMK